MQATTGSVATDVFMNQSNVSSMPSHAQQGTRHVVRRTMQDAWKTRKLKNISSVATNVFIKAVGPCTTIYLAQTSVCTGYITCGHIIFNNSFLGKMLKILMNVMGNVSLNFTPARGTVVLVSNFAIRNAIR